MYERKVRVYVLSTVFIWGTLGVLFFLGFPSSLRVRSNLFISKTVAVGVKYESSITSAGFKDGN